MNLTERLSPLSACPMVAKQTLFGSILAIGALLAAPHPSFAHHSRAMFDMSRNVTYRGVVKEYEWRNPHSHILVEVGAGGNDPWITGTWDIEASSTRLMTSQGWSRTTYKAGDPITIVAHPMKNGSKGALLFYAIQQDGTRLYRAEHRYPSETE